MTSQKSVAQESKKCSFISSLYDFIMLSDPSSFGKDISIKKLHKRTLGKVLLELLIPLTYHAKRN